MTRLLTGDPDAGASRALALAYRRGAQAAAAVVGVYALAQLLAEARGAVPLALPPAAAVALLGAALAILLREPDAGFHQSRIWRACGHAAAAIPILVAVVHWERQWQHQSAPLPGMWTLCFLLLGASLLAKPRLPRLGVGADVFVGFVGYLVVLTHLFGVPTEVKNAPALSAEVGLPLLVLAGAWLAAFPRRRPVAFFVEAGSAALILHRVLPITFVFPALFVGLAALRQHGQTWAQLGVWLVVLAVIVFGAALFVLIASALDRMDAVRETAEQELRAAAQRYRRLFDENPQPMWLLEVESLRFIGVNGATSGLYEYGPDEFSSLTVQDLRREGDLAVLRNQIISSENRGIRLRRHFTKSGRPLDMEIQVHRTNWQGREVWVCYGNDVTARLRTLEQLRSSEGQVRVLLESTTEGIYAVDMQGTFVWSNPAAARLLGYPSAADLLGQPVHSLIHHSHPDCSPMSLAECPLWAAVRQGSPFAEEMT
ncbi:MAG: PAS domain-containing protein, partial [Terriglobales bacterium]